MKPNTKVVTLLLAAAFGLISCSGDHPEAELKKVSAVNVTVATAGKQSGQIIQASGEIVSVETALISTRVMGFITDIKVKTGDKVRKGQLLVTISNDDILAKRAQAQAMVSEAEAALKDAQKDYQRFTELFKQQSASQKELENITLQYTAAKSKAETAKQMQKEAEAMLAYTNLTSPFAGVITKKNMDVGSMANPGMPILIIENSGSFQLNTSVTEADIDRVNVNADAQIFIGSTGRSLTGKVSEVSPSSKMSGGQYLVKVNIPDEENHGLHSGMYAKVLIDVSGQSDIHDNTVTIPASAIIHKDQLSALYTVSESQTALLRWVKLGKSTGDQVEVLSGLRENEEFILAADGKLYNGVPVAVK